MAPEHKYGQGTDGAPSSGMPGKTPERNAARYVVEKELGEGASGRVVLAQDTVLDRPVALKKLAPEWLSSEAVKTRFLREAQALARIDHPNVLKVYDILQEGSETTLVLEYAPGGTLEGRLVEGPLPVPEALALAMGILRGLAALHDRGLVHRDVKPANVLLAAEASPKLADLGVAQDAEKARMTKVGSRLGTPEYMSPEQVRHQDLDGRSDVYAAGIVLFEMLTGHLPFAAEDEVGILAWHVAGALSWEGPVASGASTEADAGHGGGEARESPRTKRGAKTAKTKETKETKATTQPADGVVPEALRPVIAKALAKKREDRYPTALAFAQALEQVEALGPFSAHRGAGRPEETRQRASASSPKQGTLGPSVLLPQKALVGMAVAIVVGAVVGGGLMAWMGKGDEKDLVRVSAASAGAARSSGSNGTATATGSTPRSAAFGPAGSAGRGDEKNVQSAGTVLPSSPSEAEPPPLPKKKVKVLDQENPF